MKVLITDYTSDHSTEPLYFNTIFNYIDCQSTLWPLNVSTFDIFDIVKPDMHITHHTRLSRDLAIYLNQNKNIDLVINVTGMTQENLISLEDAFKEYDIKPALYFVNYYDHKLKSNKTNITTVLHGADIFLGKEDQQYLIDYGVLVDSKQDIKPIGETYHYITSNNNIENDADIFLPVGRLSHVYNNYKNIVFRYFNREIPQSFFDASLNSNNVYFDVDDRSILDDNLKKLLGDGEFCNLKNKDSGNVTEKIKQKHTCLHRLKSLLSQLPCKKYTDNLQQLIESSIK